MYTITHAPALCFFAKERKMMASVVLYIHARRGGFLEAGIIGIPKSSYDRYVCIYIDAINDILVRI